MSPVSLRARLASGAKWTISIRAVDRMIGLATTLILARLLAPADFGVIAMGTAINGILGSLTELGFTPALIRLRRPDRDAYSTAFTLHFIACAVVALALLASAPLARAWYGDPRVVIVLLTLATISAVSGFRNFGLARYERALDFRPFFVITLSRKAASFLTGVGAALVWHDYRALLAGMLVGTVVDIALTHRLTRLRPRFTLSRSREVLSFSVWWLASQMAAVLGRRGQDLIIGQQLGAPILGKYAVALDIATMPTGELVAPVMRAVYPGYMQMKDEIGRLQAAFLNVWGVIALAAIPAAVGTACVSDLVTNVILGPKWRDAAHLMGALAVVGAIDALYGCYWPMMLTRLGPKMVFLLSAAGVGLTLPAFGITLWAFGLMPAIGAWITCSVVMLFVGAKLLLRELGGRLSALLGHLIRPLIGSAAMALVVLAIKGVLPVGAAWVGDLAFLLLLALAGALSYVLSVWVLWQLAGRPATAELQVLSVARVSLRRKV